MTNPPILLLKTKSSPHDGYDEYFSAAGYTPIFVPVLAHNFHRKNLSQIKSLFESGGLNPGPGRKYGGLIFTSQRAVEAFADMLGGVDESISEKASYDLPLYTVGPATARSLTSLRDTHLRHAVIHGADTGNGENLAHYILDHYNDHIDQLWTQAQAQLQPQSQLQSQIQETAAPRTTPNKPPLLFLVGEQRRDIIPRTLMNEAPIEKKIGVEEVVVYETGVVEGFESDFEGILVQSWVVTGSENGEGGGEGVTWVIVFSPTGCDAMVRVLAKLKSASGFGFEEGGKSRRIYVATIGPTTRDHLVKSCGFEPDVCADKPSPDGLGKGIEEFMRG